MRDLVEICVVNVTFGFQQLVTLLLMDLSGLLFDISPALLAHTRTIILYIILICLLPPFFELFRPKSHELRFHALVYLLGLRL